MIYVSRDICYSVYSVLRELLNCRRERELSTLHWYCELQNLNLDLEPAPQFTEHWDQELQLSQLPGDRNLIQPSKNKIDPTQPYDLLITQLFIKYFQH